MGNQRRFFTLPELRSDPGAFFFRLDLIAGLSDVAFVTSAMAPVALAVSEAIVNAPYVCTSRADEVVRAYALLVDACALVIAIVFARLQVAQRSTPSRLAHTLVRYAVSVLAAIDVAAAAHRWELLAVLAEERRVTVAFAGSPVADPAIVATAAESCRGVFLLLDPNVG
jgi:hypothetical protein